MPGREINRIDCPECRAVKGEVSRANLICYDNGEQYCMSCGFIFKPGKHQNKTKEQKVTRELIAGSVDHLLDRGITLETCQKYNVRQVIFTGILNRDCELKEDKVKIFPIYKDGRVIKQKVKSIKNKKDEGQFGDTSALNLFGMNTCIPTKKIGVVVTEGEEDAMSAFQMMGIPAVSVTRGAKGAFKELVENLEWLSGFKEVILCFDNDAEGRQAVTDCINIFEPGGVRNALLPLKDANEMLKEGRGEEFKKCIWNAESIRPPTLVGVKDIWQKVLTPPQWGTPYPWASLTKATYGRRLGESYLLAGPTSSGKTEFMRELITQSFNEEEPVGYFQFEQQAEQSAQRFVGAKLNKRLHIPGEEWDEELIKIELEKLDGLLWLYNSASGNVNIESVLMNIKYLNKLHGVNFFIVDNLKALAKNPVIDGKRVAVHEYASHCMSEITALCKQMNINIWVVNHLSEDKISLQAYVSTSPKNPDDYLGRTAEGMQSYINRPGMTWESGRMSSIQNIFGGGAIKDLTDYIIVIGRNRMSEDDIEHRTIRVKMLKTRLDSSFENFEFRLIYNYETGRLTEVFDQEVSNRDEVKSSSKNDSDTSSLE